MEIPTVQISLNVVEAQILNQAINDSLEDRRRCSSCQCDGCAAIQRRERYLDGIRGKFIQWLFDAEELDAAPEPAPHVSPVLKARAG